MSQTILELRDIAKSYSGVEAVRGVTLSLAQGEVFSLLGPSGCGKTTLLRVAAGFEIPDQGIVRLAGKEITDLPPNKRQLNTVFQNYALFPHMTVAENVGFGRQVAGVQKTQLQQEVAEMLKLMELEDFSNRRPGQLSGGQKQRVAIARALINRPQVLLLDEPLGALDLKLRQRMLLELDRIHDEVGITFLYVTHDQSEAMSLSDRIAVMNEGRIEQMGSPAEIYQHPKTRFVASFIGDTHLFEGQITERQGEWLKLEVRGLGDIWAKDSGVAESFQKSVSRQEPDASQAFEAIQTPQTSSNRQRGQSHFIGKKVVLSVRPEQLSISREPIHINGNQPYNQFEGKVEDHVYLGAQSNYYVRVGDQRIQVSQLHAADPQRGGSITWGDQVCIGWKPESGWLIDES